MGELLSPGPYSGLGEQAPTPATLRKANQRRGEWYLARSSGALAAPLAPG